LKNKSVPLLFYFLSLDIRKDILNQNMKKGLIIVAILAANLLSVPLYSQTGASSDSLGLPGDNLDLFAVLDLFQKSKTIEDFETSLNDEKTGINNLDLNLDNKIDFIKVQTKQQDKDFTFILQVDVTDKETQDVAVILVSKDKNDKVTMQIVGDKDLYGKDYVVEPKAAAPAVTPNPAYTGADPATAAAPASTTTVVVVESAPVVQYVYSPVYVPYYPPYHYGYYPPYFRAATVVAVGVYRHNNYYHHGGYYGGHGNTVVIHNTNNYNNYNNSRNSSNTVNHNNNNGNYNSNNNNRPSNTSANKANKASNTAGNNANRPATSSNNAAKPASSNTNKPSASPSSSSRSSSGNYSSQSSSSRPSTTSSSGGSRGSSGSYSGGGGSRGGGGRRR
jgi:uncharacterized membrane protein YgcG